MIERFKSGLLIGLLCLCGSAFAVGGLQPSKSRVIYHSSAKEASVQFFNHAVTPLLVQAWVDDGDVSLGAAARPGPYDVMPPVCRIEPAAAQNVRIFLSAKDFPRDREHVSYLNVMYTDPVNPADEAGEAVGGAVRFSIRHRIKIFYRPKGLRRESIGGDAPILIRQRSDGDAIDVELVNPGPFYVTLAGQLKLISATDSVDVFDGMIAPFETLKFRVARRSADAAGWAKAKFSVTGDYGDIADFEAAIER